MKPFIAWPCLQKRTVATPESDEFLDALGKILE
jgi:hypothetical protein